MSDKIFQAVKDIMAKSRERAIDVTATKITEKQPESKPDGEKAAIVFKAIGSDDRGVIYGIGAAAGSENKLDEDLDFVPKYDLVTMAYDFCRAKERTFKANHKTEINCELMASMPGAPIIEDGGTVRTLKADEALDDNMTVVGIDIRKGNESHWFVAVNPLDPEVVEIARKGGVAGFSFGAYVTRTAVE